MRYSLFTGCNIPARVEQYFDSAMAICSHLKIDITHIDDFICCGYPVRNLDEFSFLLSSARNLARAEIENQDLMVLCKCCYGSLKTAQYHLNKNPQLVQKINVILNQENLNYTGKVNLLHFLSVLHDGVGINKLKKKVKIKYKKLSIAASVGCHALRPSNVTQFDDSAQPALFDNLVKLTGAKPIAWSKKTECCGAPLLGINDDIAEFVMKTKLLDAQKNHADFIAVACPYSFLQFDQFQADVADRDETWQVLPPILYPQLLGLSFGLAPEQLGIDKHVMSIDHLQSFLSQEVSHA